MKAYIFEIVLCLLVFIQPVYAVKIISEPSMTNAQKGQSAFGGLVSKETNNTNDRDTLREGKIQEIDFQKQTMRIHDTVFSFNVNQVKVFSHGHKSSITLLSAGHRIRFLLDANDTKSHMIAVIYLTD